MLDDVRGAGGADLRDHVRFRGFGHDDRGGVAEGNGRGDAGEASVAATRTVEVDRGGGGQVVDLVEEVVA